MDYDNDYGGAGAFLAIWLVLLPVLLLFALAGYLLSSWFLMKIFEKAGVQGKWRAWVPVYNLLVFAKLGDLSPWVMLGAIVVSALLGQIPLIGWVLSLVATAAAVLAGWRVGLKLGKDWPYLLLWLIPGVGALIWLGINAFDKSRWNNAIAPAPWAGNFLADKTVWSGIPAQQSSIGYAGPGGSAAGGYPPPQGYQEAPQGYQAAPPPVGYQPPADGGQRSAAPASPPPVQPPAAPAAPAAEPYTPPATEPPSAPDAPRV